MMQFTNKHNYKPKTTLSRLQFPVKKQNIDKTLTEQEKKIIAIKVNNNLYEKRRLQRLKNRIQLLKKPYTNSN